MATLPLPLPPLALRHLVGPLEDRFFDNASGAPIFPELRAEAYDSVLDFGCGCGRLARQLVQQKPRPRRYLGLDLHAGMVDWCRRNLAPHATGFDFQHHDVRNLGLNPNGHASALPFPMADGGATLVIAWSVFTHVNEPQAEFYLREVRRVLAPRGTLVATFFLFDKGEFPMMQSFQNALFVNDVDPTNAVIFDGDWLLRTTAALGLVLTHAVAPKLRGFQWLLHFEPARPGLQAVSLPADDAPRGSKPPPLPPPAA
jgi:SAM-dependent methyltransferase